MLFNYRRCFKEKEWIYLSISGLVLLFVSFVINSYAGKYANASMSNSVSDIILSNIRAFDVDGIFIYGAMAFWIFIFFLALAKPLTIPFVSKSVALFIIVRSVFISLTHIGVFPTHLIINPPKIFGLFSYYGDLFFSGHTGLPFLMALLFWNHKNLRIFFITTSIFFAAIVLLGHLHYSIDVLGSFFITYSIFHMATIIFKRDKVLFDLEFPNKSSHGDTK